MSCPESLPEHVLTLLKTSKYLHLATCSKPECIPSVSLMNYTYISPDRVYTPKSSPASSSVATSNKKCHYIIMATQKNTEKYENIIQNPQVSVLIHDWVTAKKLSLRKSSMSNTPTPAESTQDSSEQPPSADHPSRLLNLLQELNQSELSQMSATLRGYAEHLDSFSDEFNYYEQELLKANPDARVYTRGENVSVVKVKLVNAKVSDNENNTKFYD
ncbi:LAME_0F19746g1_1 [Lachancea meyersii CBS 8951]|uniref:LAME_0F19746g1_1 n=1 Tax=Lachancea meyersii CBS 8951 TaxID=1266667 RepID=A0A1G4K1N0_9SACH|nr:LAME_0F19746g1_1 [Lachancea meyersii CBS 8951]